MRDVSGHKIIEGGKEVKEDRIVYEFVNQAFLQATYKHGNIMLKPLLIQNHENNISSLKK